MMELFSRTRRWRTQGIRVTMSGQRDNPTRAVVKQSENTAVENRERPTAGLVAPTAKAMTPTMRIMILMMRATTPTTRAMTVTTMAMTPMASLGALMMSLKMYRYGIGREQEYLTDSIKTAS
jgi:hypothetical protein